MDLFSVFLVAVALAMDCFAVSISVGLCRRDVPQREIAAMGLFFGGFQAGMTIGGYFCGAFVAERIGAIDHWIAFLLLGVLGVKMIYEAVKGGEECTLAKKLSFKTLSTLAIATSLDALAVGFSFGLIGNGIALAATVIGLVSLLLTEIGANIGKRAGKRISPTGAEVAGGVVLVAIGVKILVEHLTAG